jgi:AraC family transcriptional regulator
MVPKMAPPILTIRADKVSYLHNATTALIWSTIIAIQQAKRRPRKKADARIGSPIMSEIGLSVAGHSPAPPPIVDISPCDIAHRRLANWGVIQADVVRVTRRETFEYGFLARRHLLIAYERAERQDGETLIEGLPKSTLREFSRKLSLVPAGHRFHGWQTPRVLTRLTYFYIDRQDPLSDPESPNACRAIRPRLFFFDQAIWDTALKLKAEVGNADPGSRQYAEALGIALMHELFRLERANIAAARTVRGGLPAWQQKRLAEFIEVHLAEHIPLAALAELVDLSLYHFARAFTQSFGMPPHRYHWARRMDRARSLLRIPALSVTQIGSRIGFCETSSFTRAFRRFTGLTPSEYRRQQEH